VARRERMFVGVTCGRGGRGIDAALIKVVGRGERMKVEQLSAVSRPVPEPLRTELRAERAPAAGRLAEWDRELGRVMAEACRDVLEERALLPREVAGVGMKGHTTVYQPPADGKGGGVLELGSAATLARQTGMAVVGGFCGSDMAAGGVGGPMTAWAEWLMLRDRRLSRVVVQLSAIASITFVGTGAAACEVVAFDTGAGTVLIDHFARQLYDRAMDEDGSMAARGRVDEAMLNELLARDYFRQAPPKRTCPADWTGEAAQRIEMMAGRHRCRARDLLATVTELTARTVADGVLSQTERPHEVILAGGGARNIHLAGRVRALLSPCSTYGIGRYGLDMQAHAAVCYAVLAAARMDKVSAHCHLATGAEEPAILGAVTLP